MLSGRGSQVAVGFLLLTIGVAGVALAVRRGPDRQAQPDVGVKISGLDGTVQVFVGCEQAAVVTSGEARELDLGRMPSDEVIFVSVTSHDHNPSWDVEAFSNGEAIFEDRREPAEVLGFETEANAIVSAEAFTAGGHEQLGSIGCQAPGLVDRAEVPEYLQSPDESEVPAAKAEESPYRPRHFPYDQIDAVGRWSLPALALLGVIMAFGSTPIRRLARSYGSHIGGTAGVLGVLGILLTLVTTIALGVLLAALTFAGVALLFAVSLILLFGLEGPAGASGAEG
jgi:hypothetical protein